MHQFHSNFTDGMEFSPIDLLLGYVNVKLQLSSSFCVACEAKSTHRDHDSRGVDSMVKLNFFRKCCYVAYLIKGMERRVSFKHIYSPYTHPQPFGWIKRPKKSECGHVAYQIKGK